MVQKHKTASSTNPNILHPLNCSGLVSKLGIASAMTWGAHTQFSDTPKYHNHIVACKSQTYSPTISPLHNYIYIFLYTHDIPIISPFYLHDISNLPNNISISVSPKIPKKNLSPPSNPDLSEAVTRPTSARCPSPIACDPLAPPVAWTAGARAWPCVSVPGWCRPSWRRMCCGCWGRRI